MNRCRLHTSPQPQPPRILSLPVGPTCSVQPRRVNMSNLLRGHSGHRQGGALHVGLVNRRRFAQDGAVQCTGAHSVPPASVVSYRNQAARLLDASFARSQLAGAQPTSALRAPCWPSSMARDERVGMRGVCHLVALRLAQGSPKLVRRTRFLNARPPSRWRPRAAPRAASWCGHALRRQIAKPWQRCAPLPSPRSAGARG